MSSKVVKQVLEKTVLYSQKFRLLPAQGARLAVAVSGGADSTALLHLLYRLAHSRGLELHVFHFDHRMQSVSRTHARFVSELCARLSIPFHVGRWTDFSKPIGFNGQASARRARFAFFEEKAKELGIRHIALAHTADDQAETLLWRLIRGTAPGSLGGISPKIERRNLTLIRPLLSTPRSQIEAFLQAIGQDFCHDPSNDKTHYLRNRIRHELLPLLVDHFNPKIREHLYNLSESLARENRYLNQNLKEWIKAQPDLKPKSKRHLCAALAACPQGLRFRFYLQLLKHLPKLNLEEIKLSHLQGLERLIDATVLGRMALPSGWSVSTMREGREKWLVFEPFALHSP